MNRFTQSLILSLALTSVLRAQVIYNIGNLGTDSHGDTSVTLQFGAKNMAFGAADVYSAAHVWKGNRAFVWDAANGIRQLGTSGFSSSGLASSELRGVDATGRAFGSTLLYSAAQPKGNRAFMWTSAGGMVQLGTLGTDASGNGGSVATAGNGAGTIYGDSGLYVGGVAKGSRGFVWDKTLGMRSMGNIGTDATGFGDVHVLGANTTGSAYGTYNDYSTGSFKGARGFVWDATHGTQAIGTLGTDSTGFGYSSVAAVDASGRAYGGSNLYVGGVAKGSRAVAWDSTNGLVSLGNLGVNASGVGAAAVNFVTATGTAFGTYFDYTTAYTGNRHAFVYDSTGGMRSLGTLSTNPAVDETSLRFIDAKGNAYGNSQKTVGGVAKGFQAFRWTATGGMQELGVFGTDASGKGTSDATTVDKYGSVFGSASDFVGGKLVNRAFVWTSTQGLRYLGSLFTPAQLNGWTLETVQSVTDDGWAFGTGFQNGTFGNYALNLQAVPEPGTLLAFAAGAGVLLRRRRKS